MNNIVSADDRIGVARARISEMRTKFKQMRHTAMCSVLIDGAPVEECDCERSAALDWLDHIESPLVGDQ